MTIVKIVANAVVAHCYSLEGVTIAGEINIRMEAVYNCLDTCFCKNC